MVVESRMLWLAVHGGSWSAGTTSWLPRSGDAFAVVHFADSRFKSGEHHQFRATEIQAGVGGRLDGELTPSLLQRHECILSNKTLRPILNNLGSSVPQSEVLP